MGSQSVPWTRSRLRGSHPRRKPRPPPCDRSIRPRGGDSFFYFRYTLGATRNSEGAGREGTHDPDSVEPSAGGAGSGLPAIPAGEEVAESTDPYRDRCGDGSSTREGRRTSTRAGPDRLDRRSFGLYRSQSCRSLGRQRNFTAGRSDRGGNNPIDPGFVGADARARPDHSRHAVRDRLSAGMHARGDRNRARPIARADPTDRAARP